MSVAQISALPERTISPLMSNNPFRNRINSQTLQQPQVSSAAAARPASTNPFLDSGEIADMASSMTVTSNQPAMEMLTNNVSNMNVDGQRSPQAQLAQMNRDRPMQTRDLPKPYPSGPARRPDQPQTRMLRPPGPGHRVSNSEEESRRQQARPRDPLNIFADPAEGLRRGENKPRRNSESSLREPRKPISEEERRERDRRHQESKRNGTRSGKPSRKLDVIDKLDVTSIYGTGLFHHDGPFDACNPHRNRKKEKYAPMQAFPKDSVNMVMGGSGPVNKTLDYDKFHGVTQEAHIDYNEAAIVDESTSVRPDAQRNLSFNPTAREVVHGEETTGLGATTFLEGAPASRQAMQRRESEYEKQEQEQANGLGRKKSIAQRIRAARPVRDRLASPETRGPTSPLGTGKSESAVNPFFKDYDKKDGGAQITFSEDTRTRARAPSSPKRYGLERSLTADSAANGEESKSTGLLGRMKSLKGGRRPTRRDNNN